jgi:hypothetical protein
MGVRDSKGGKRRVVARPRILVGELRPRKKTCSFTASASSCQHTLKGLGQTHSEEGITMLFHAGRFFRAGIAALAVAPMLMVLIGCAAPQQQLLNASSRGDRDTVQRLLAQGVVVNEGDRDYGETPLMMAAFYGHPEVVEVLIAAGADVYAKCLKHGQTALMKASDGRSAELLIAKGAWIDATALNGGTALIFATLNGHKDVAALLIAKGANVNAKADEGSTALMLASVRGYKDLVELLLANGADVDAVGAKGRTALSVARDAEVVELLKKHGAGGMRP